MIVSLAEAAELTGKSRQTIYRKAKKGELLLTTREDDSKGVDTTELERVFGVITVQEASPTDVTVSETAIRQDPIQAEEMPVEETQPEAVHEADSERELSSVISTLQRHQETINEQKSDYLKLWDQVVTQQHFFDRNEQMITSLQ